MTNKEKLDEIIKFLNMKKQQNKSDLDKTNIASKDYLYLEGINDATENISTSIMKIISK